MKHFKHLLCLLLAGSLLFSAACGSKGDDGVLSGEGRFIEIDITPPIEGRFTSYLTQDGIIVCFSDGLKSRFESADGGDSWTESPGPGKDSDRYQFVQGGALLPDGKLLAFIQGEGLLKIAPDGKSEPYPVSEIDKAIAGGENVFVSLLQAFGDKLLVSYSVGGFAIQNVRGGVPIGGSSSSGGGPVGQRGDSPVSGYGAVPQQGAQGGAPEGARSQQGTSPEGATSGTSGAPEGEFFTGRPVDPSNVPEGGFFTGRPVDDSEAPEAEFFTGRPVDPSNVPEGGFFTGRPVDASGEESDEASGEEPTEASSGQQTFTRSVPGAGGGGMNSVTSLLDLHSGQPVANMPVESMVAAISDDSSLYMLDMNSNVKVFNLSDGTPSGKPDIKFGGRAEALSGRTGMGMMMMGMMGGGNVLALAPDGGLYVVDDGSLLMADESGSISTVLERTAYSIGAPNNTVSSMFVLDDGSIVANLLVSGQTNLLYKYVFDKEAKVNPEKVLAIWSMEENGFVRAAIAELRKKHPDSYVTYEVALGGDNAVSASDAIRTLNTQLLNGSGPDVIVLDGCPVESYAARGMLMDVSGAVDTGGVFDSLLASYIRDGKLFFLPTQFMAPVLMGSEEALAKAGSLSDLVAMAVGGSDLQAFGPGQDPFTFVEEADRAALYFNDLKEMSNVFWTSSAPEIVKDNKLDTGALRRYLEAVKAVSDKYGLVNENNPRGGRMGMAMATYGGGAVTEIPGSLMYFTMQRTQLAAFRVSNLLLLNRMMEREGAVTKLFPGMAQGAWQPSTVVGISADTEVPEFAAAMIQTMLSVDVQRLNSGTGLPVTQEGIDAQIEQINYTRSQMGEDEFAFEIEPLIGQLRAPAINDTVLSDMMWSSVERCCRGEIDVEGAVREIEQNIKNYLAERQ